MVTLAWVRDQNRWMLRHSSPRITVSCLLGIDLEVRAKTVGVSADALDWCSGADGAGDLGDFVDDVEQVRELLG